MHKFLSKFKRGAITHDGWTSKKIETYASLSVHVIDEEFNLFSCPFDVKKLTGHTYASCITDIVSEMTAFRDIKPSVSVTDCEPSMVAAWRTHGVLLSRLFCPQN